MFCDLEKFFGLVRCFIYFIHVRSLFLFKFSNTYTNSFLFYFLPFYAYIFDGRVSLKLKA